MSIQNDYKFTTEAEILQNIYLANFNVLSAKS